MVFYVTMVTLINDTSYEYVYKYLSWMIQIWMNSIPIIETKFA